MGPHALPGGDCSEAHRNFRGDGHGECLYPDGVYRCLVYGIVDLRFAMCSLCMFYFSKEKNPGVKTLKDSCRDCPVLRLICGPHAGKRTVHLSRSPVFEASSLSVDSASLVWLLSVSEPLASVWVGAVLEDKMLEEARQCLTHC